MNDLSQSQNQYEGFVSSSTLLASSTRRRLTAFQCKPKVLLLAVALSVASGPLMAQGVSGTITTTDGADSKSGQDGRSINSNRSGIRFQDQALVNTMVIKQQQIQQSSAKDLGQLIESQAGINLLQNGGPGSYATASIRGSDAKHVLVLVDGVPLNSLTAGGAAVESIPLASVERIVVQKGNLSSIYGSQASAGVIEVFTFTPFSGERFNMHMGGGTGGQAQGAIELATPVGEKVQLSAGISHHQINAISSQNPSIASNVNGDKDAYRSESANLKVATQLTDAQQLTLYSLYIKNRIEYDNAYAPTVTQEQWSKGDLQEYAAHLSSQWGDRLSSNIRLSHLRNDAKEYVRDAGVETDNGRFKTTSNVLWGEANYQTDLGVLTFGSTLAKEKLKASVTYDENKRDTIASWLGYALDQRGHHLQMNARVDHLSNLPTQTSASIRYGYDISPQFKVLGSYGNAFAAPSFNDLYYPGFSNPNLKHENSTHGELAIQYTPTPKAGIRLTGFDQRYRNKIVFDGTQPQNINRARSKGLETEAWLRNPWVDVNAGVTYLHAVDRATEKRLPRTPKWLAHLGLNKSWGAWSGQADWTAKSDFEDGYGGSQHVAGHGVLDLGVHYDIHRDWRLGLKVNNAFDQSYESKAGYNSLDRQFLLTVDYSPKWLK